MRVFGIIGHPLGHSFSRDYFTQKFAALGLQDECRYYNFPLADIAELSQILAEYPDLAGFNVTIPYKKDIIPWLDALSPEAREIGAVNCVKVERAAPSGEPSRVKLTGYNTDAYGFAVGLEKLLGSVPEGARGTTFGARTTPARGTTVASLGARTTLARTTPLRALILGDGGAAAAVKYVLDQRGIEYQTITRKNTYHLPLTTYHLIINATPLGTFPDTETKPDIPYDALGPDNFLYDLVYNPPLTAFLKEGQSRGAKILNGETMLRAQAEKSWEIWNNY